MIEPLVVQELFRYNRWANTRASEAVSALTQGDFVRELRSSHSSVRDTLTHIVSAEWLYLRRAFVKSLTAERLLSTMRYVNLQGESWEYPLWRQMYHVVNHSGYHRGQLATLLRQLGARPLLTDFLVFHDQGGDR